MKRYSILFKVPAFLLAILCFLTAVFCGYGTLSLVNNNLYQDYPYSVAQAILYTRGNNLANYVSYYYAATQLGNCPDELTYKLEDELPYTLYALRYSSSGQVTVYTDEVPVYTIGEDITDGIVIDYALELEYPVLVTDDQTEDLPAGEGSLDTPVTIYQKDIVVNNQTITCDYYYQSIALTVTVKLHQSELANTSYEILSVLYPYRYAMIAGLILSTLVGICLTVYLIWVAGRDRQGQVAPVGLSKLPLDIYLVCAVGLYWGVDRLFYSLFDTIYEFHQVLYTVVCISLTIPLLLGLLYIAAAQYKQKDFYWWHNTIIGKALRTVYRGIRALFRVLPAVWQWLVIGLGMGLSVGVSFYLTIGVQGQWQPLFLALLLICVLGCIAMVCYGGYCFGTLLTGLRKIAQGELTHQIPEKYLFGRFKDCARQINSLSDTANAAMQSQIRSERMKTELITNVSHDIKTPLTSIINFVDLLEKPHSAQEEGMYLEVLSRQSQRLKKLIEDLMDLSKANTGNMAVNLTALDAAEAAQQALGEFADKLDAAQLVPVFRAPEQPLMITADGRLLWRVLSNLLSNAVKYAAPGTRVYVDLVEVADVAQLSIRNISAQELTISAEELLERFVRGDTARNTEGSGLGLNIAKSLTEVQGGQMDLLLDGDLFKVTLTFPKA